MRQLRQSNDKIAAIAYENGFCDLSHFNRTFKRFIGISPGKYRKSGRINSSAD
jgi:AraC-like DNA-binding protein